VVQTAAKLVLEPIFEVDFEDNAYLGSLRTWPLNWLRGTGLNQPVVAL
jgi:hypothetical protein